MAKNDVTKSKENGKSAKNTKANKKTEQKKGGVKKYMRDLKAELKKVTWPTRKEVINNTGVVMGVMVIMALFLFAVDSGLGAAVQALLKIGG